jgi:hypothetical protein
MNAGKYKRYVICPECNNELVAETLVSHFRRAHKKRLTAARLAEILSRMTREPTRKPNRPRDLHKYQANLKARNQKESISRKIERTPLSMRQWDAIRDDIPIRSGPLGPG